MYRIPNDHDANGADYGVANDGANGGAGVPCGVCHVASA